MRCNSLQRAMGGGTYGFMSKSHPQGNATRVRRMLKTEPRIRRTREDASQEDVNVRNHTRQAKQVSIYFRIGRIGLLKVVWKSTPFILRSVALPYGLHVYGSFLRSSCSLQDVLSLHSRKYMASRAFRLLRPRYHRARDVLAMYGIK